MSATADVTTTDGALAAPRFDESLASAARGLHLGPIALAAVVGAVLLLWCLERRGRAHWAQVPVGTYETDHTPYRASSLVVKHMHRAPGLILVASFGSLAFGNMFTPLILLALWKYPFDGIAIPLVPGVALALINWLCAWLLLGRSPHAEATARSGAVASLMANVGLLGLAAAHFVVVELQRRDGIAHACSSSVTFVVLVFAISSVLQALVTMAALRHHQRSLVWKVD
jgi:hypothetical protein